MKKLIYSKLGKIITFLLLIACTTAIITIGLNFSRVHLFSMNSNVNTNYKRTSEYRMLLQDEYSRLCVIADLFMGNDAEDRIAALNAMQKRDLARMGILDPLDEVKNQSYYFVYYISNGENTLTNSPVPLMAEEYMKYDFRTYGTYYSRIKNQLFASDGENLDILNNKYASSYGDLGLGQYSIDSSGITIYLAPNAEFMQDRREQITNEKELVKTTILILIPLFAFAFLLIILQIIITGKTDKEHLHDGITGKNPEKGRFKIEVVGLEMLTCIFLGSLLIAYHIKFGDMVGWFTRYDSDLINFILCLLLSILAGLLFVGFLYLVRRLKQKNFMRSSIIYCILRKSGQIAVKFWRNYILMDAYKNYAIPKRLFLRQIAFFLLMGIGIFITLVFIANDMAFFGLLMLLLLFILIFLYIYRNNQDFRGMSILCEHIDQLYKGNSGFQSTVSPDSIVSIPAMQLNNISEGVKKSVDVQVKAERIKIDLVTNVSHDLKTPLTSIIGYIDLLSKQELNPEASDYVKILGSKADRLKNIVSDLFELAKITSGNEELVMEKLDCVVLVKQVLADMEDVILASKKSIKINIEQESVLLCADGSKLYRIYQNLLDNALKYSMEGTRIFFDLKVVGNQVVTTIKNTASYALNFDPDEIMERFTRGDQSRSGEGNGLGLSIAKGFANACGGDLRVDIDGDLFKATVSFPIIPVK